MILLASWTHLPADAGMSSGYQVIEMFAGKKRVAKLGKAIGLVTCAHDILYDKSFKPKRKRSPKSSMDINDSAGFLFLELVLERLTVLWSDHFFNMWLLMEPSKKTHHKANLKKLLVTSFREPRLCIITILHGTPGDLLCILGVLCSTWTVVNSGTSGRDFLVPMGRTEYESVRCGNLMVARQGFGKHPPKVFNHCFVF